jgi:hypothetical protein
LTVVLKRVLADRRQAEDERPAPAAAPVGDEYPVAPDLGERRLGMFVVVVVVAVVVVLTATLSRLPGFWGSPDPSTVQGVPDASAAGDASSAGDATLGPAGGTPTGSGTALPPAGAPRNPAAAPGAPDGPRTSRAALATGGPAAPPGPGATAAAPGGTTQPGTTAPAAIDEPEATAEPVQPDVQAALADLSAAIHRQVDAGQLAPFAGDELQSKVHQVAREVGEGNWAAARYYADRIREKLRKYREDGYLTSTGYQALIARLNVVDDALS